MFTAKTDLNLTAQITRQYSVESFFYRGALWVALVSPMLSLVVSLVLAVFFVLPSKAATMFMESARASEDEPA
ncbi:MAG: hypothetical protein SGI73_22145 [Chloroflexota bacterium]|nr:hypothetical protein [Chloroflexota bacterium]